MGKPEIKIFIEVEMIKRYEGACLEKLPGNGGYDLKAFIKEPITLHMLDFITIPTGVRIAPEWMIHADVRATSGLRGKHGVYASLGLVDNIYRGDIGVVLHNLSRQPFTICPGDKIAQLTFWKELDVELLKVRFTSELGETSRGELGFGGQSGIV